MDFARARYIMVESQVRTADVTDLAILSAMRALPRERFAPSHKRAVAYGDMELETAPGRCLMRPRDLAKLIQALAPRQEDNALEIAGATGYGAAVLARCAVKSVTCLDADEHQTLAAKAALDVAGAKTAKAVTGPHAAGWSADAPYDLILINGAVEVVPEAWGAQLADGGRLGVIVRDGPAGEARIYTKSKETLAYRAIFDAAPPVIPGLERPRAFTF